VDPSSDVLIWKAVGSAGEQKHFPRFLKSLANFFKVNPRGDAKSLQRRQERQGLSPVYIRDRASNPNSEIELQ
jgi:hypothetical protein